MKHRRLRFHPQGRDRTSPVSTPVASNQATQDEPTVEYQKLPEPGDLEARSGPAAGTWRLGRPPLPRRPASANYNGIGASTFNGHPLFSTFEVDRLLWEQDGTGTTKGASRRGRTQCPTSGRVRTVSVPAGHSRCRFGANGRWSVTFRRSSDAHRDRQLKVPGARAVCADV